MTSSNARPDSTGNTEGIISPLIDPRFGDVEDDASSPGQRSLLAITGSLLVEISLPKLLFAWTISLLLPALRIAETNFWSLNALAVQPGYAFGREALRHLTELTFGRNQTAARRARLRAANSLAAGLVLCACAALIAVLAWPASHWRGSFNDLVLLHRLVLPTLANAIVLVSGYLAVASLVWGVADASMDQPFDLAEFDPAPAGGRIWRIAHLSDLHVVGERYGFRIESGRAGPRGNERLNRLMVRLAVIHSEHPLDHVIISGDMTDAGRASEWAELLDALSGYPELAARTIVLPGNHDLNIVDRANPARLDLPFSPGKRLRQVRVLSAIAAVHSTISFR